MASNSRIGAWIRSLGRSLGFRPVEDMGASSGVRETATRKPNSQNHRLEVDAEARRLRDNILGSTPRITAGELSQRAERRLHLVQSK